MPALLATSLAAGLSSPVSAGFLEDAGGVVKDVGRAADGVGNDIGNGIAEGLGDGCKAVGICKPFRDAEPKGSVTHVYKDGRTVPPGTPLPRVGKRLPAQVPPGTTLPRVGKRLPAAPAAESPQVGKNRFALAPGDVTAFEHKRPSRWEPCHVRSFACGKQRQQGWERLQEQRALSAEQREQRRAEKAAKRAERREFALDLIRGLTGTGLTFEGR
jgi:hypothetical protein